MKRSRGSQLMTATSLQPNSPPSITFAPSSCCSLPSGTRLLSSSIWKFNSSRSRRVTTSLENVAPTSSRAHSSSTSLLLSRTTWWESWQQLGSGKASQVKHQKLRNKVCIIRKRWIKYEIVWMNQSPGSSVFEQLQNVQCKVGYGQIGVDSSSSQQLTSQILLHLGQMSPNLVPFPVVGINWLVRFRLTEKN